MHESKRVPNAGVVDSRADGGSDGSIAPESQLVVLPDSPDTRLLVELTSHANDLAFLIRLNEFQIRGIRRGQEKVAT